MFGTLILIASIVFLFIQRANLVAVVARFIYAKGKTELAMKIYDIAYKIGKMNFGNSSLYAYLTLKTGNVDRADKLFNLIRMTGLKPHEKMALKSSHALVFWKKGDVKTAIEMLEEVVENAPSTNNYGSLGYMYIFDGQYQKALEFNLKAYDYNSSNIIIVENLALTYFKLGEMENAKKYYDELMALNPQFPDCLYEYGQFLIKCGDIQEGINQYKKALQCNFSFMTMVKRTDIIREIEELEAQL